MTYPINQSVAQRLPLDVESFKEMREGGYYYIDKSLIIRDVILSGTSTFLLTRPRRFGKALNLSMLHTFFE